MARPLRIEYPGAYYHVINRISVRCKQIEKVLARDRNLRRDIKNVRAAFTNN